MAGIPEQRPAYHRLSAAAGQSGTAKSGHRYPMSVPYDLVRIGNLSGAEDVVGCAVDLLGVALQQGIKHSIIGKVGIHARCRILESDAPGREGIAVPLPTAPIAVRISAAEHPRFFDACRNAFFRWRHR